MSEHAPAQKNAPLASPPGHGPCEHCCECTNKMTEEAIMAQFHESQISKFQFDSEKFHLRNGN